VKSTLELRIEFTRIRDFQPLFKEHWTSLKHVSLLNNNDLNCPEITRILQDKFPEVDVRSDCSFSLSSANIYITNVTSYAPKLQNTIQTSTVLKALSTSLSEFTENSNTKSSVLNDFRYDSSTETVYTTDQFNSPSETSTAETKTLDVWSPVVHPSDQTTEAIIDNSEDFHHNLSNNLTTSTNLSVYSTTVFQNNKALATIEISTTVNNSHHQKNKVSPLLITGIIIFLFILGIPSSILLYRKLCQKGPQPSFQNTDPFFSNCASHIPMHFLQKSNTV
jgi:hypothetical protein